MHKYIIIGDVHGRTNWKDFIDPSNIVIFVGDYTDPYPDENISYKQMIEQFKLIIEYKKEHPDTVLLLGNHDISYLSGGITNRYDFEHAAEIKDLIMKNLNLFQIAYNIENKYVVSHAGITLPWYRKYFKTEDNSNVDQIVNNINDLFFGNINAFTFGMNSYGEDSYGTTPTHSPVWIRPQSLMINNIFYNKDVTQIVGHTNLNTTIIGIKNENEVVLDGYADLIFVDTLEYNRALLIDVDLNWTTVVC